MKRRLFSKDKEGILTTRKKGVSEFLDKEKSESEDDEGRLLRKVRSVSSIKPIHKFPRQSSVEVRTSI